MGSDKISAGRQDFFFQRGDYFLNSGYGQRKDKKKFYLLQLSPWKKLFQNKRKISLFLSYLVEQGGAMENVIFSQWGVGGQILP